VVQISAYKSCAAFIREARKAGYGGTFYNVSFVGTQALADELGKDGAGVVVSQVNAFALQRCHGRLQREFVDAVKAAGKGAQANFSSMEGYIAARLLVDGLSARAPSSRAIRWLPARRHGQPVAGGFSVSFSPNDHVASSFVELSMLTATAASEPDAPRSGLRPLLPGDARKSAS